MVWTYNTILETLCEPSASRYYLSVTSRRAAKVLIEDTVIDLFWRKWVKAVDTRVDVLFVVGATVTETNVLFPTKVVIGGVKGTSVTKAETTVFTSGQLGRDL